MQNAADITIIFFKIKLGLAEILFKTCKHFPLCTLMMWNVRIKDSSVSNKNQDFASELLNFYYCVGKGREAMLGGVDTECKFFLCEAF